MSKYEVLRYRVSKYDRARTCQQEYICIKLNYARNTYVTLCLIDKLVNLDRLQNTFTRLRSLEETVRSKDVIGVQKGGSHLTAKCATTLVLVGIVLSDYVPTNRNRLYSVICS